MDYTVHGGCFDLYGDLHSLVLPHLTNHGQNQLSCKHHLKVYIEFGEVVLNERKLPNRYITCARNFAIFTEYGV